MINKKDMQKLQKTEEYLTDLMLMHDKAVEDGYGLQMNNAISLLVSYASATAGDPEAVFSAITSNAIMNFEATMEMAASGGVTKN